MEDFLNHTHHHHNLNRKVGSIIAFTEMPTEIVEKLNILTIFLTKTGGSPTLLHHTWVNVTTTINFANENNASLQRAWVIEKGPPLGYRNGLVSITDRKGCTRECDNYMFTFVFHYFLNF